MKILDKIRAAFSGKRQCSGSTFPGAWEEPKRLKKPYEFECRHCGRTLTRYTDCKVKVCYCGAKNIFT